MKPSRLLFIAVFLVSLNVNLNAQTTVKNSKPAIVPNQINLKSSPAFAELILRKTELLADLESLLISYTEEFPKIKELRFEIDALDKETARLTTVKENSKLTLALGKLLVRKAELTTDFWSLQKKYGDEHPDVKRAKRKIEIYENAIKEILN